MPVRCVVEGDMKGSMMSSELEKDTERNNGE